MKMLQTLLLISQDTNWWTGVVWIIRTLILTAPIHSRASIDEQVM